MSGIHTVVQKEEARIRRTARIAEEYRETIMALYSIDADANDTDERVYEGVKRMLNTLRTYGSGVQTASHDHADHPLVQAGLIDLVPISEDGAYLIKATERTRELLDSYHEN